MQKVVFLLYEGDAWLMRDSLRLMGVYSSVENAIESVLKNHSIKAADVRDAFGYPADEMSCREDVNGLLRTQLEQYRQTQGFYVNYIIEEKNLDPEDWDE